MADYEIEHLMKLKREGTSGDADAWAQVHTVTGASDTPKTAFDAWWTDSTDQGRYRLIRTDTATLQVTEFRLRSRIQSQQTRPAA